MAITDLLSSDPVSEYRSKINAMLDVVNIAAKDLSGTLAGRPAANSVDEGTYYFVTDAEVTYRSDGANWKVVGVRPSGDIDTAELADGAVTTAKLGNMPSLGIVSSPIIATGAGAYVGFSSEVWDTSTMHDTSTDNSRFVAPVKGLYVFDCQLTFESGSYTKSVELQKNRTGDDVGEVSVTGSTLEASIVRALKLEAGDYLEIYASQNSGVGKSFTFDLSLTLLTKLP